MTDVPEPNLDPTSSPDAQEGASVAHSAMAVILIPLSSGNIAVLGRDFQLHTILYDAPTLAEIRRLSRELYAKLQARKVYDAESQFYGEPSEKQMVKDIKNGERRAPRTRSSSPESLEL
jgi:hypothetical protein